MKLVFNIYKIKENKNNQWSDWCTLLMSQKTEAEETLKEEKVFSEFCGRFVVEKNIFIILASINDGSTLSPTDKEINLKHMEEKKECLEFVCRGEEMYLFFANNLAKIDKNILKNE